MRQTLNAIMEFDHVIRVTPEGVIIDQVPDVYAPELSIGCDEDGQISAADDAAMIAEAKRQGWDVLTGWSGQYGYSGPLMHPSEFVGCALEEHIRETPGLWAVVIPSMMNGDEFDGWVLVHRADA